MMQEQHAKLWFTNLNVQTDDTGQRWSGMDTLQKVDLKSGGEIWKLILFFLNWEYCFIWAFHFCYQKNLLWYNYKGLFNILPLLWEEGLNNLFFLY